MRDIIDRLTHLFSRFPTIGPRTAGRFVFYLIGQPKEKIDELISALEALKNTIKICKLCFNPFEPFDMAQNKNQKEICPICSDSLRKPELLCIIEKENDLISIENTKKYKGLYFILGGTITSKKPDGAHLRIDALKNRVKNGNFSEIIIAINLTPEGRATSLLVERALKELSPTFKITHLATGLPIGSELEYADEETLEQAFEGRK
jgi:recombination protein RecR